MYLSENATGSKSMFYRRKIALSLLRLFGGELPKLQMQKYLFLTGIRQEKPSYEFVPHRYGCFSFQAEADRRTMIKYGWLKNNDEWSLASTTNHAASLRDEDIAALHEVKRVYGRLSRNALLKRIYLEHPFFAINSEVLDDVLDAVEAASVRSPTPKPRGRTVFTLGYEGVALERFLRSLVIHDVRVLCDVRRNPLSMKYGFSKTQLSRACDALGIRYVHLPDLGIASAKRQKLDSPADYARLFDEYEQTTLQSSTASLQTIMDLVDTNKRIALVCFEASHEDCHRSRLAAALPHLQGWNTPIRHISA